jgi:hypothetical protein
MTEEDGFDVAHAGIIAFMAAAGGNAAGENFLSLSIEEVGLSGGEGAELCSEVGIFISENGSVRDNAGLGNEGSVFPFRRGVFGENGNDVGAEFSVAVSHDLVERGEGCAAAGAFGVEEDDCGVAVGMQGRHIGGICLSCLRRRTRGDFVFLELVYAERKTADPENAGHKENELG